MSRRQQTNLSVEDVARAIAASEGTVRAIIEILYASGARVSELCALTWGDVDSAAGYVRLQGKGGDARRVPIGPPALTALLALPSASDGHSDANTRVFPSLTTQNVRDRLRAVGRRVGIRLTPHLLRHAFASHMHLNGASERVLQELLGHVKVSTTMIYLDGCERRVEEGRQLITQCLAAARGLDADPRSLKRVIAGDRAGLILR
jgi:site-specific recombinase XerD